MENTQEKPFSIITRMIMIDSYKEGKIHDIPLAGHTNLNGTNGTGKTSLLVLPSVFMGAKPSKVVVKNNVIESFTDYYLPRDTSYLIFEYLRKDQPCMAFMYRATNGISVNYRFADKGFELEDFTKENESGDLSIVSCRSIKEHLESRAFDGRKVYCSRQITSLEEYIAIIQNLSEGHGNEHRLLLNKFSFAEPEKGKRLKDSEKIYAGMLSKKGNFDELLEMLVNCITEDNNEIKYEGNFDLVKQWYGNYIAFQDIDNQQQNFNSISALTAKKEGLKEIFSEIDYRLDQLDQRANDNLSADQKNHDFVTGRLKSEEDSFNSFQSENQLKLHKKEIERKDKESLINALNNKKQEFESSDITGKKILVREIPMLEESLHDKKMTRDKLIREEKSECFNIEMQFKESIDKAISSEREYCVAQESEKNNVRASHEIQYREIGRQCDVKTDLLDSKYKNDKAIVQSDMERVSGELTELTAQMRNVQADDAKITLLKSKEKHRNELQNKITVKLEERNEISNKIAFADKGYQRLERDLVDLSVRIERVKNEIADNQKLLDAHPNTLLHFLRHNKPEWQETIGKVIQKDLLLKDDLHPEIVNHSENLFGVSIDLSHLNVSQEFNVDEISINIQLLNEKVLGYLEEKEIIEKEMRQVLTERSKLENDLKNIDVLLVAVRADIKKSEGEILSARQLIDDDIKAKQAQFKIIYDDKAIEKQSIQGKIKNLEDEYNQARKSIRDTCKKDQDDVYKSQDIALAAIDNAISNKKKETKQEVEALQKQKKKSLEDNKIDSSYLDGLDKSIRDDSDKLTVAKKAFELVTLYDYWHMNEWPKHSKSQADLDALKSDIKSLEDEAENKRNSYFSLKNELEKKKAELDKSIKELSNQLGMIFRSKETMSAFPKAANKNVFTFDDTHTYKFISDEINVHTKEFDKLSKDIIAKVEAITKCFKDGSSTQVFDFYLQCDKRVPLLCSSEEKLEYWIGCINEWFTHQRYLVNDLIFNQTISVGLPIRNYQQHLQNFNDKVAIFSTNLSKNIDTNVVFEGLTDIEVGLTSKVKQLGFWSEIKDLAVMYDDWHRTSSFTKTLPNKQFADLVCKLINNSKFSSNIVSTYKNLVDFNVVARDNGKRKVANNSSELNVISSRGKTFLLLSVIYVALFNMIRKGQKINIISPVDEIGDLSGVNAHKLMNMFRENYISIFSATPDAKSEMLSHFKHKLYIDNDRNIKSAVINQEHQDALNSILIGE